MTKSTFLKLLFVVMVVIGFTCVQVPPLPGTAAVSMAAVEAADASVEALGTLTLRHHVVEASAQAAGIRRPQVRAGHPRFRRIVRSCTSTTVTSEVHRTFPPRFLVRTPIQAIRDCASDIPRSLRIILAGQRTLHSRAAVLSPAFRRARMTDSLALMVSAAIQLADSAGALAVAGDSGAGSGALDAALASAALALAPLASDPFSTSVGAGRDFTDMTHSGMARTRASVIRIIRALDIRATQSRIAIPIIPVLTRIWMGATHSLPTTIWA